MRGLALVAMLAACGDNVPPPQAHDAGADATADAAAPTCGMVVGGAVAGGGPCTVFVGVHGPHGYDPAPFGVTLDANTAIRFYVHDFGAGYLAPPRASLTEADTDSIEFGAMFTDGTTTWRASGGMTPTPLVGSFTLAYDHGPGVAETYPGAHGTLDVTLISDLQPPAQMRVTF